MTDLAGRTFLVTGANTGIGLATATALAGRGATVFAACRSAEKGQAAVARMIAETGNDDITFLPLNLADLAEVKASAKAFLELDRPLHVLVNNAGVAGQRGQTGDGFELMFGVNHLGHFALTLALLDRLKASGDARVVNVSSDAHFQAKGIDFEAVRRPTRAFTGMPEYAVSKLANVLFSQELARRTAGRGVTSYALHPGVVASDIWRRVPWPVRGIMTRRMLTVEQGSQTSLLCATSPELAADSGKYYENGQAKEPSKVATPELAGQLWSRSESWAGV
jgi:NAD(P)-dependent dehydrogenase (short-subunit alcohol dehydrogenase family)